MVKKKKKGPLDFTLGTPLGRGQRKAKAARQMKEWKKKDNGPSLKVIKHKTKKHGGLHKALKKRFW